jgi:hypothetical protein
MRSFVLFALLGNAASVMVDSMEEDSEWKMHPVQKVVKLLKEMQAQLEKEAEEDDEIMDKMVCWCETNDKGKTKAIADAELAITELTQSVEENTAMEAQLKQDIEQLTKDVAENTKELATATGIREKENAEFTTAETNTKVSIEGLKNAVAAMSKGRGDALNQESLLQVKQFLRRVHGKQQPRGVTSFLQMDNKAKSPGSGEVLGVLKQMQENFEINLKELQQDETEAATAYSEMKAAKEQEIAGSNGMIDSKSKQSADAVETLAQADQDLKDTKTQLEADTTFLADLKERCGNMDEEFAMRKKTRTEEITAVGEALSIITSDDAKDNFQKTQGFVQIRAHVQHEALGAANAKAMMRARVRVARLFLQAGLKQGTSQLMAIGIKARSDVFAKIKEAIDAMLKELKQQQADEVKHKDFCIQELNQNEMQTGDTEDEKKATETHLEKLTLLVETVDEEIAASKAAIDSSLVSLKGAAEDRMKENTDFKMTIQDQRATQKILGKALEKLQDFYNKKALLQLRAQAQAKRAGQAPPPGFGGEYKKSGGATAVMMMIEGVIKEAKTVEEEATAAEQEAQTAYEEFVANTNKSVEALNRGITEKKSAAASADEEIATGKGDLKDLGRKLEELITLNGELHGECDFTLKNFEYRQAARAKEMETLMQGKAILSGANI